MNRNTIRDQIVQRIEQLSAAPSALVLTGEPDVGKSSPALTAAAELRQRGAVVLALSLHDVHERPIDFEAALGTTVYRALGASAVAPVRVLIIDGAEAVLSGKSDVLQEVALAAMRAGLTVVAVTRSDGSRRVLEILQGVGRSVLPLARVDQIPPCRDQHPRLAAVKGEPTPLVGSPPRPRGCRFLQVRGLSVCIGSGIRPAINGEIRPGNVRGLRTGDERHQRGDLINMPIAIKRCGGLLRHRSIALRGIQIQIRVDRTPSCRSHCRAFRGVGIGPSIARGSRRDRPVCSSRVGTRTGIWSKRWKPAAFAGTAAAGSPRDLLILAASFLEQTAKRMHSSTLVLTRGRTFRNSLTRAATPSSRAFLQPG